MRFKGFICGLLVGAVGMTTAIGVMAESETVEAYVSNAIFKFNGKYKIPSGPDYSGVFALNYNGRLYVPAGFVAEGLGAEAKWDIRTNTVNIDFKEEETTEEESTTVEVTTVESETVVETTESNVDYRRLPVTLSYSEMDITATIVEKNDDNTKIYIRIKNRKQEPLYLQQSKAVLKVGNKEYKPSGIASTQWSTVWDTDIRGTSDSYLIFPAIDKETKNLQLEITVIVNDFTQKEIVVPFNISLQ